MYDFVWALSIQLRIHTRLGSNVQQYTESSVRRLAVIQTRLKSAEKEEREWAAVMNEWLKRLIYSPGLNALTLP